MAEEEDQTPRKLELSPVQVAASALAAVSAAFFASWAGTAGTMIGAALGSVIATVGAATYSYSLKRTSEIARRTALQVREGALLPPGLPRTRRGAAGQPLDETSVLPAADGEVGSEHAQLEDEVDHGPWWRRLDPRGKDLPWGKVALAAAAVMLVTMAVLTSFEGLTGRSVSDTVTGNDTGRTTVGNVFGGSSDSDQRDQPSDDQTQQPTQAPSGTPSGSPTSEPTEDPSESPSQEPTETGVPVPTAPTPTLPATPTPTPSADPDAGAGTASPSPSS